MKCAKVKFDYLIVGSGLSGAVCARELSDMGFSCLVIDKRNHIGGNCYTDKIHGIDIHKYGPHIFHTNNESIWKYVNKFSKFNNYRHKVKVNYKEKIYSFPINLDTIYSLYQMFDPNQAKRIFSSPSGEYDSLKSFCIEAIGKEMYEIFIEGYTKKQWGKDPQDLPASIIRRIPFRYTFDDNYYYDDYQGIPKNGYTDIFNNLLSGCHVDLCKDFFSKRDYYESISKKIIFTGPIDKFFEYKFGKLEYRSLRFEEKQINAEYFQGCAQINFTDENIPYTRIIEHKHFNGAKSDKTIITKEFPKVVEKDDEFYPINDEKNLKIFKKYHKLISNKYIFLGRLAEYRYYDMHQVIASALKTVYKEKYGRKTKQSFNLFLDSCSK